ncbi:MAG: thiamine-phosphate kinase [Pseudomonadota bacterium]
MDEFALINEFFKRHADGAGIVAGIGDDGAVVETEAGRQVHVLDTLVQGVHFPDDTAAADIGWRSVAVNLSDIAAMGATPQWMTLGLALPDVGEDWVRDFAEGLFEIADQFGVQLIGGDTTRGPVVVVTVAMTGRVPGEPLLRSGAKLGDTVYVTGTLGDAAAGLTLIRDGKSDHPLATRFNRPTPRIDSGRAIGEMASACIDVSDGLVGDLKKLCVASGVGAEVDVERLPLSEHILTEYPDEAAAFALTGGDDYELCFTANADVKVIAGLDGITAIGTITAGEGVTCRQDGTIVDVDDSGYRHFR